jgi:hypothetical protein
VSTGRSIHAAPSITPSPREGIEGGPRLRVRNAVSAFNTADSRALRRRGVLEERPQRRPGRVRGEAWCAGCEGSGRVKASTCAAPQAQAAGAGVITASPENAPGLLAVEPAASVAPAVFLSQRDASARRMPMASHRKPAGGLFALGWVHPTRRPRNGRSAALIAMCQREGPNCVRALTPA